MPRERISVELFLPHEETQRVFAELKGVSDRDADLVVNGSPEPGRKDYRRATISYYPSDRAAEKYVASLAQKYRR